MKDVVKLQELESIFINTNLKGLGLYRDKVDGSFGKNTEAAVKKKYRREYLTDVEFADIVTG